RLRPHGGKHIRIAYDSLSVVSGFHIFIIPEITNTSSAFSGCEKRRSGGFTPPYACCNDWGYGDLAVAGSPLHHSSRVFLFRPLSGVWSKSEWSGCQPDYRRVGGQ